MMAAPRTIITMRHHRLLIGCLLIVAVHSWAPPLALQRPKRPPLRQASTPNNNEEEEDDFYNLQGFRVPPSSNDDSKSSRIQAKFDNLFAGMPSVGDILGSDKNPESEPSSSPRSAPRDGEGATARAVRERREARDRARDDTWFAEEKQTIVDSYDALLREALDQLEQQRRADPESVPDNAEAMVRSILKEEMDTEIIETRNKRLMESIAAYEQELRADTEEAELGPVPERVQQLMDEDEAEQAQWEASRVDIDDFLKYEEEAFRHAAERETDSSILPAQGADLDQWALERLQAMASRREEVEGSEVVLDILEERVGELSDRIEKESKRGSIAPGTMKEWQMYRAIATRLAVEEEPLSSGEETAERERKILGQLESWKKYIQKEALIREESGLSRGPKLPFEWQELDLKKQPSRLTGDSKSRAEVRKEINRMSIQALESLLLTADPSRRAKIQDEIDYLKSRLEANDYLDVDESFLVALEDEQVAPGPIDISDIFSPPMPEEMPREAAFSGSSDMSVPDERGSLSNGPRTSPSTAFFSDRADRDATPPPPPKTAFFTDGEESSYGDVAPDDSKLGTFEEQRLNAMYRRAGARTPEEQAAIRSQWEDFKQVERAKREQSGLGVDSESKELDSASLKYNVSEVIREDGDFDADKILATIGPRPQRTPKSERPPVEAGDEQVDDPSLRSTVGRDEVRDSMYRAVSAVGGGRYKDDPEAKARQQASFEDFLRKQDEVRETIDRLEGEPIVDDDLETDFDDREYAEDVLASLGPRPRPKRTRIIDEGEFSDQGGVLASEDDEDDDEDDGDERDEGGDDSGVGLMDSMPDWLRKDRERGRSRDSGGRGSFLGSDIDEVFDDDDYDKKMRQLHEYEQRRAGQQRRMGIDISDVLGRRGSDDYADYKYDDDNFRGGWGVSSFASRKSNLLDYTELDITELNSLMDHKDSVYSTGVSQYLPRINKPFKEFGAIFRLEGVLIDVLGIQLKAWTKVAVEFGFKAPVLEDVQRAAVISPEIAVREAFFWTDDFLECKRVAAAHREAFRKEFDAWMEANGLSVAAPAPEPERGSLALGAEVVEASAPASPRQLLSAPDTSIIGSTTKAWQRVAEVYGKPPPSEAGLFHAASLIAEAAVKDAFQWSDDPVEMSAIAQGYRELLQTGAISTTPQMPNEALGLDAGPSTDSFGSPVEGTGMVSRPGPLDENAVMEMHFYAWKSVAERFGFETPEPEEAMAAFVINDPVIAVRDGFGWTEDPDTVRQAVAHFQETLEGMFRERSLGFSAPTHVAQPTSIDSSSSLGSDATASSVRPVHDKAMQGQADAWSTVAQAHGFITPTVDVVRLAVGMEPREAVQRLFRWSTDASVVDRVVSTYQDALASSGVSPSSVSSPPEPRRSKQGPSPDDIFLAVMDSWVEVARRNSLTEPDLEQVQFALSVGPEEAILTGFEWTEDLEEVARLVAEYKQEVGIRRQQWSAFADESRSTKSDKDDDIPMFSVAPDAARWVKSLLDVDMQCGIVSYLERDQVDVLLEHAGLAHLFPKDRRLTATDGYKEDSQQLLGAALRLERRPDHCVVFDSSPYASIAAHDNDMRNVNIIGAYPRYELLSADTTTSSFDDLTAMNIRRLFGERVYDQPMLETAQAQPEVKRQPKTQFWDED